MASHYGNITQSETLQKRSANIGKDLNYLTKGNSAWDMNPKSKGPSFQCSGII